MVLVSVAVQRRRETVGLALIAVTLTTRKTSVDQFGANLSFKDALAFARSRRRTIVDTVSSSCRFNCRSPLASSSASAPSAVLRSSACTCMPGFHTRYTGMPGLNSYSMPGSATCDTGHKALCPVSVYQLRRLL